MQVSLAVLSQPHSACAFCNDMITHYCFHKTRASFRVLHTLGLMKEQFSLTLIALMCGPQLVIYFQYPIQTMLQINYSYWIFI